MGVNSLPKTVTGQRRGCDLNPVPSAPESSTLTTRLPNHPPLDRTGAVCLRVVRPSVRVCGAVICDLLSVDLWSDIAQQALSGLKVVKGVTRFVDTALSHDSSLQQSDGN